MGKNDRKHTKQETKQASTAIAIVSLAGLTACFIFAVSEKADVPLVLYAIFGGGVLGTDNLLKLLKSVFRIGNDK